LNAFSRHKKLFLILGVLGPILAVVGIATLPGGVRGGVIWLVIGLAGPVLGLLSQSLGGGVAASGPDDAPEPRPCEPDEPLADEPLAGEGQTPDAGGAREVLMADVVDSGPAEAPEPADPLPMAADPDADPEAERHEAPVAAAPVLETAEPDPPPQTAKESGFMARRRAELVRAGRLRVRAKLAPHLEPRPEPEPPAAAPVERQSVPAVPVHSNPVPEVVVATASTYQYGRPPVHQEIRLRFSARSLPRRVAQ
jgi:hypothetical protein